MTILSAQSIRSYCQVHDMVSPFNERTKFMGTTFGLGPCSYDVRIDENILIEPGEFMLASTMEKFFMPISVVGKVHDKSTWARRGVAVQNTLIDPGWRGYLTLEITNHGYEPIDIKRGMPIAQVVFELLDYPTDHPYRGKYQDQEAGPQEARYE